MKKVLYITFLLIVGTIAMWAQNPATNEYVTFEEKVLTPGGEYEAISVNLATASKYTSFSVDIYLPAGLEFYAQTIGGDVFYAEEGDACTRWHMVDANIQTDGSLRVTALSTRSSNFVNGETELFKFYVKVPLFAKPGMVSVDVNKCFYVYPDATKQVIGDVTISDKLSISTSAQSPLTIKSENKWSTLILPFSSSVPTGVTAYTCSSKDEAESVLNLAKVASLEAFTPYILYSENGYEGTLEGTVAAEDYPASGVVSAGLLKGAITQQVASSGEYVLANQNNETRFYKVTEGKTKTIPAGKCWASFPSASAKESFGLHFNPTSIKNVEANGSKSDKVYSIDGKQIKNGTPRGLYIANGRKMIGK